MSSSEDERPRSIVHRTVDTALSPFRVAISKPAQRAYLGTFLLATTSIALLCISSIAYWLFYYNFVPQLSLERVVHLQFDDGHPHGIAVLGPELASLQPYDVSVSLQVPRTPSNLGAGNFMLDLSLYTRPANTYTASNTSVTLLSQSRRSAILTYASPLVDTANRVVQMPWYVVGWRKEDETLEVPMMERVEFAKGWRNLPGSLRLALDSEAQLQVYNAKVKFIARFSGLRWIMYNYRILAFIAFTSTFWSVSMTSATIAWLLLSTYLTTPPPPPPEKEEPEPSANGHANGSMKAESEEPIDVFSTESLSDSQRTFPSFGRQMPLRFPLPGRRSEIKRDGELPVEEIERTAMIEPLAGTGEADDEDEEEEEEGEKRGRTDRDSGLGTSLEEGGPEGRRREAQRRRSRLFDGGD